jgi:hypothetical protein
MMKSIIRSFGALAVVLAAISASAQPSTQVSVPFAFAAAGRMFPAGDYRVSLDESNQIVSLRGQDLKTIFMLTAPGDSIQDERSVLRFQRDGDEWSLQGIAFDGTIRRVPLTKMKRD